MSQEKDDATGLETQGLPLAEVQDLDQGRPLPRWTQGITDRGRGPDQAEPQDHEPTPVDANEVKDAVIGELQAYIEEMDATVEAGQLPTVRADRHQLHTVLLNLLSNAIKFVPDERAPNVQVRATVDDSSWRFAVEDNGTGLSPVDREGIFQRYHRGENAQAVEGDGVGLAVCRRIVEGHGGRIWVESGPGPGSTFYFTLPIGRGSQDLHPVCSQGNRSSDGSQQAQA